MIRPITLLLSAFLLACPSADDERCLVVAADWGNKVFPAGEPLQLFVAQAAFSEGTGCLNRASLEFERLDSPGAGTVEWTEDNQLVVSADVGGVYALVNADDPFSNILSFPIYFARRAGAPAFTWPRSCEEVVWLGDSKWACDGAVFDGQTPVETAGEARWLRRPDGALLAVRPQTGIVLMGPTELGSDGGALLSTVDQVLAWDVDPEAVSVASPAGFFECSFADAGCVDLGPRFGTGDVPFEQQRIVALMRRDGRTIFSVSPAGLPWCEARAEAQTCATTELGPMVAVNGHEAFAAATAPRQGTGYGVAKLQWQSDGGWIDLGEGFFGPPEFLLASGLRGVSPSRVIFTHGDQVLFWSWNASAEAFHFVDVKDGLPGSTAAGAGPGYFWYSQSTPVAKTELFLD